MATTIATTYAGEFKEKYIREMLLAGKTLDNGGMTIFPNVAFKEVIQKAALSGIISNGSCDYLAASAQGTNLASCTNAR